MTTIHRIHPTPPMRGRFHLDVCHEDPGEVVIYVVGELDIATTSVLRTCLSDLLEADTPWPTLKVDLSAAPFVDVSSARLLLDAHRRAEERGTTLTLVRCTAQLVRLLHLAHLVEVVESLPARGGRSAAPVDTPATAARTDLSSGNGVTPHLDDTAATEPAICTHPDTRPAPAEAHPEIA